MPVDASIANDLFLSSAPRSITQSPKCICFKQKKIFKKKKKRSSMWKIGYTRSIGVNLWMLTTYLTGSEQYKYCIKPYFMHVLCVGVEVHMLLFFLSIPVCLSSFPAQKMALCECRQYWQRYESVGAQYPVTILQLTHKKVYKYTYIYINKDEKNDISVRADLSAGSRCECFTVHACLLYVFRWAC